MSEQSAVIRINLESGKIYKKSFFGTFRPFVVFFLGDQKKQSVVATGPSPFWGVQIEIPRNSENTLYFKVYDKGRFSNSSIGEGKVNLTPLINKGHLTKTCSAYRNSKKKAELKLTLEYIKTLDSTESRVFFSENRKFRTPPPYNPIGLKKEPSAKNRPSKIKVLSKGITLSDISFKKRIYQSLTGKQEVYIGELTPNNTKVAIKVNYCESTDEFNSVQREALTMSQLSHRNICVVYSSLLDFRHKRLTNLLVMEKCEGLDLYKEISKRAKESQFWSEEELWKHFTQLIDAFSLIQQKNIVHSDIKPQNLVYTPDQVIKVIDFGISLQGYMEYFNETSTFRMGGTVPYFSPLQLEAYMKFLRGENHSAEVRHNPFKSDVYSLGLTFVHMASLEMPQGLNDLNHSLQQKVDKAIEALGYSDKVKQLLHRMLKVNEKERPNFKELKHYFL